MMLSKLRNSGWLQKDRRFAPLSYRYLRILGWLCILIGQIGVMIGVAKLAGISVDHADQLIKAFGLIREIALPLFLLANFSVILNGGKKFSSLILFYGGISLLIFAAYAFAVEHYLVNLLHSSMNTLSEARAKVGVFLRSVNTSGFFAFNVFLDLFLCTLFSYFMLERPSKHFQGSRIRIFRSFAVIPVLYEIASFVLKVLYTRGRRLSPILFPLLTTKPPMMFFLFVGLVLVLRTGGRRSEVAGESPEQFSDHLRSKVRTRLFSLSLMGLMIVFGLLDILVKQLLPHIIVGSYSSALYPDPLAAAKQAVDAWGFGRSSLLLFLAPFSLLISFSKTHKNSNLDLMIPVAGMGAFIYVFFEGVFQMIRYFLQGG